MMQRIAGVLSAALLFVAGMAIFNATRSDPEPAADVEATAEITPATTSTTTTSTTTTTIPVECSNEPAATTETDTDENVDASTTTTTEAAETNGEETEAPTTTVLNLGTNDSISTVGLGEVTFGMTVAQAQVAAGTDLINCAPASDCYRVTPARGPEGISFLVTESTIERVDIVAGPLTTRSGIGIGSPEDDIINLFGDQIETQVNDDSSVDLIFVPQDESDAEFRVIFTIRDGVVETFRSGRIPQVTVQNPCAG